MSAVKYDDACTKLSVYKRRKRNGGASVLRNERQTDLGMVLDSRCCWVKLCCIACMVILEASLAAFVVKHVRVINDICNYHSLMLEFLFNDVMFGTGKLTHLQKQLHNKTLFTASTFEHSRLRAKWKNVSFCTRL
jgi:hypothetical protein